MMQRLPPGQVQRVLLTVVAARNSNGRHICWAGHLGVGGFVGRAASPPPGRLQQLPRLADNSQSPPAAGDMLELTCEDLAFGGEGVCRMPDGFVVFVDRALPGERLMARVVHSKKNRFAKAAKLQTLRQHDNAAEPVCQHYGPCGGCSLQSLQYEAQLAAKQRQVSELLRRTAGLADADVAAVLRPIVGCAPGQQYRYRNKMEFSSSLERWQPVGPGGTERGGSSGGSGGSSRPAVKGQRRALAATSATHAAAGGRREAGGGRRQQAAQQGQGGAGFALGLHRPGSSTAVLPISSCSLQSDAADELLRRVLQLCQEMGVEAFDPTTDAGLLQHVVIRRGTAGSSPGSGSGSSGRAPGSSASSSGSSSSSGNGTSGGSGREEYLVNLVTARDGRQALQPLARALMAAELPATAPQQGPAAGAARAAAAAAAGAAARPPPAAQPAAVVGVVNSVGQPGRPAGERRLAAEHVLAGRGWLTEQLQGLEFQVSANSFFQTNTAQADVLYGLVAQAAELRPTDVLLDLYCGIGSIGLSLAARCHQVHGVEISAAAVGDAERNARLNGITNATFLQGDLHKLQLEGRLPAPDVVVVDPARPGLSPALVTYLRGCGARRIVYVSCNASTQTRDIRLLCAAEGGGGDGQEQRGGGGGRTGSAVGPYRLASMQACDLYPQTWHVETVAALDAVPGTA